MVSIIPAAAAHEIGHHHDHERCQVTYEQVQVVALGHPDGFGQGVGPHHCCEEADVTCAQIQVAALDHLDGAGHGVGPQHWEGDNVTHAWEGVVVTQVQVTVHDVTHAQLQVAAGGHPA